MKKIFTAFLITLCFNCIAQAPLEVIHSKDEMTDKEYWFPSRKLVVENKAELKAFAMTFYIDKDKTGIIKCDMIDAKLIGFKCLDDVTFIFMFENDEKLNKMSFVKFNCDGNAGSWLTPADVEKFSTLKVKKIRASNGKDGTEVTGDIAESDYFIKLLSLVKEQKFTKKKK